MGVYGIVVLSFFSSSISVVLILMCGIAVSSSPAVCGFFHPSGQRVLGKRRSFMILWYRSFALSCVNIWKTLDLTVNEYAVSEGYSMMKLVGHRVTWLFDRVPINSRSHVFSQMLRLIFWCIHALN